MQFRTQISISQINRFYSLDQRTKINATDVIIFHLLTDGSRVAYAACTVDFDYFCAALN